MNFSESTDLGINRLNVEDDAAAHEGFPTSYRLIFDLHIHAHTFSAIIFGVISHYGDRGFARRRQPRPHTSGFSVD